MSIRRAVLGLVAVTLVAGAAGPVTAAPKKKPIKKTYTAQATPDPTSSNVTEVCNPTIPTGRHSHAFKAPAAGKIEIKIAATGDWSLGLRSGGRLLADSDGGMPLDEERILYKVKKAMALSIDACNFAGGPTATVSYTFTYN